MSRAVSGCRQVLRCQVEAWQDPKAARYDGETLVVYTHTGECGF